MKRTAPQTLALLVGVLLAGCGGGDKSSSPSSVATTHHDMTTQSTRTSTHDLAQTYLRIVAPANAAIARLWERANSHGPWTRKQFASVSAPVIPAYEAADKALLRVHWPPRIRAKVKALVRSNRTVADMLSTSLDTRYVGVFFTVLDSQTEESQAAANIVRAKLRLPRLIEGPLSHKFG